MRVELADGADWALGAFLSHNLLDLVEIIEK